jgi:hypothetical protein
MGQGITWTAIAGVALNLAACQGGERSKAGAAPPPGTDSPIQKKLTQYTTVRLTTDLGKLTPNERKMIPLLIDAARSMDEIFWWQAYGGRDSLLRALRIQILVATPRSTTDHGTVWITTPPSSRELAPSLPVVAFTPRI